MLSLGNKRDSSDDINDVRVQLERNGFAVVNAGNLEREVLARWANRFGRIQNHPKADRDGIVELITHRSGREIGQFDRSRASAHAEFLPHSDGAFVDGFCEENGLTKRVGPPCLFLLQCVKAADVGGESLLIDCQTIFDDLRRDSPEFLSTLLQLKLNFCGGRDSSLDKPLFERISVDRWRVRFRSDLVMVEESAQPVVRSFFNDYVRNPKYHREFALKPGEILIADNFRLLHGRKSIEAKSGVYRQVRRLWVWDDGNGTDYVTLEGKPLPAGAFQGMERYGPLPKRVCDCPPVKLALGIQSAFGRMNAYNRW